MRLWRGQVKSGESPKQNLQKNMCPVRSWAVTTFCCWNSMAISRFGRVHPVLTDCNPGFGRCLLVYDKELPPRHTLLIFIHVASNPFLTLFTPSPPPNFSKCWMFVHAIPFTPQKKKIQQEHPQWPSCSEIGIEVASLHVGFQLFHHLQRLGWSKMTNKHWIPGVIFSKGIRVSEQRHTCEKTWKIPCKLHQF